MCECLDYEDGDRYQCPVCADMSREADAALAAAREEVAAKDARIAELEAVVGRLLGVARWEIKHAYKGRCPDDLDEATLDPGCPACQIIAAAQAAQRGEG